MQPLDDWRMEVVDLMANADLVFATVNLVAQRGAHRVECAAGHVFRLDAEARIVEVWGFVATSPRSTTCSAPEDRLVVRDLGAPRRRPGTHLFPDPPSG